MSIQPLLGQHHVSAITANASENYRFYTKVLGLRLVKKTINQDDPSVYHLFYADERGNPGTDLTFFEIPRAGRTYPGTNSISSTALRVPTDESIAFWKRRFEQYHVDHDGVVTKFGRQTIAFRDFEGQRLELVSDENNKGISGGKPWKQSPIPTEHGIIGLGPVKLTVSNPELTASILVDVMGFRELKSEQTGIRLFEIGEGGTGGEIILEEKADLPRERPGRGSVHHVAFRVENEEQLREWVDHLKKHRIGNSGFVERYYFKSLYFREPNGILFELATDGPGFESDEPFEQLGETLALPPYFEDQRSSIEAKLRPLSTTE